MGQMTGLDVMSGQLRQRKRAAEKELEAVRTEMTRAMTKEGTYYEVRRIKAEMLMGQINWIDGLLHQQIRTDEQVVELRFSHSVAKIGAKKVIRRRNTRSNVVIEYHPEGTDLSLASAIELRNKLVDDPYGDDYDWTDDQKIVIVEERTEVRRLDSDAEV